MKSSLSSACLLALLLQAAVPVQAAPNHLQPPPIYDNAGYVPYGQTFKAVKSRVYGVKWYIGDPTRPDEPCCDELVGRAFLVLYDATDPNKPVLLARTKVQREGEYSFGVSTYCFASPVAVTPGRQYFLALETTDIYGLGLRSQTDSTYPDGGEATLQGGQVVAGERDTSFNVLSKSCTGQ
jgi:hypothetical protein